MPPPIVSAAGKKRPPTMKITSSSSTNNPATKRVRTMVGSIIPTIGSATTGRTKKNPSMNVATVPTTYAASNTTTTRSRQPSQDLKARFIQVLEEPAHKIAGITNSALKARFGDDEYLQLASIVNELTGQARLSMSKTTISSSGADELVYTLRTESQAAKFVGLDVQAHMVYQVIERAGNMGIWTKDIRIQTNIQQITLNKIFKALESRQLIKPVKSVNAKNKKLYMLYDLTPSSELTGGVWYSDLEFDHEFIQELRTFLLHCVRRLNHGKGVSVTEMREKIIQAKVSRVDLRVDDILQIVQTLVYDYLLEEDDQANEMGETVYVMSRPLTGLCEFYWWEDALAPDFHFRTIHFEDGVTLPPHEPHYHSA